MQPTLNLFHEMVKNVSGNSLSKKVIEGGTNSFRPMWSLSLVNAGDLVQCVTALISMVRST